MHEGDEAQVAASIRARTETEFQLADFLKPHMEGPAGIDPFLAPVFYLDAAEFEAIGMPGAASLDSNGQLVIDPSRPTVYYTEEVAQEWGGRRQLSYVWLRSQGEAGPVSAQGLRISLDPDGQPALVEVLKDSSGFRVLFASERLEAAAVEAYGGAHGGRSYALEREHEGEPRVVLAAVFGLGSMPTGPIVYLAQDTPDVMHVHCRCEASQVQDIRGTLEYELVPLTELDAVWSPAAVPSEREWGPPGAVVTALRVPPDSD